MPAPAAKPWREARQAAYRVEEAERAARAELARLEAEEARLRATTWCPHVPHERQRAFLAETGREALYGGGAGGGKTDALLMAALQYVDVPRYSALLLRRTYPDLALPGAIMDRAGEWLRPTAAEWSEKDKVWTFPSGARLTFGYCNTEQDRFRYQSAEFQFVGVDELTQFPERWYVYLLSRLRRLKGSPVPLRARGASNPGGVGHEWVKRRFVEGGGVGTFVPALARDNPFLDVEEYVEQLRRLDAVTRRQLLDGEWVSDAAGLVYGAFREERDVSWGEAPECDEYVVGVDYGFRDETAFALLGWRKHERVTWVVEVRKYERMIPSDAAEVALSYEKGGRNVIRMVGDVGGLGKGYAEEARQRWGVAIEAAEKTNKVGYVRMLNGALEREELKVWGPGCEALVKEWKELPWGKEGVKEAEGFDNHAADACLYAWRASLAFLEAPRAAREVKSVQEEDEEAEAVEAGGGDKEWWEGDPEEEMWR